MIRKIARLARTSPAELRFRLVERSYVVAEAGRFVTGRGRWQKPIFSRPSVVESSNLQGAAAALDRGDRRRAGIALTAHLARREPRFALHPSDRGLIVARIQARFPSAAVDAAARADRVVNGTYDLLGYAGLTFSRGGADIDWHLDPVSGRRPAMLFWSRVPYLDPAFGDHKVIWELNRHQHWLTLGRAAWLSPSADYPRRFRSELASWLQQNPPYHGANWSSMLELAFRSLSWIWALHLFADPEADDADWVVDLLGGLQTQLDHVSRHLSWYFSPNTHLLGEGLALYVAGRALPELQQADNWEAVGRRILLQEAHAQVQPDGGHAEQSLHYHLYALDFYLLALVIARRTGDTATDTFAEVASRMARFCRAMADKTGRLPTIGDDDGEPSFRSVDAPPSTRRLRCAWPLPC
ncbi:MAG: hypothetical protein H0W08_07200 [Acidobacteria bacterium]|nr:hypothetical protein [Acidobacteriota bacterium]